MPSTSQWVSNGRLYERLPHRKQILSDVSWVTHLLCHCCYAAFLLQTVYTLLITNSVSWITWLWTSVNTFVIGQVCDYLQSRARQPGSYYWDNSPCPTHMLGGCRYHKTISGNFPNPKMQQTNISECTIFILTEIGIVHISVTKWCIMGCGTVHCGICATSLFSNANYSSGLCFSLRLSPWEIWTKK